MGWLSGGFKILSLIGQGIINYITKRQEIQLRRLESQARVEEARVSGMIQMMQDKQNGEIRWEELSIQNSGWKDEWFTVTLTLMLLAVFFPQTQQIALDGFQALAEVPVWFQVVFIIAVSSAFGVKAFGNFVDLWRTKK